MLCGVLTILFCLEGWALQASVVTNSRRTKLVDFRDLTDKYSVFLLDMFGVLHDGTSCYAGSAECIRWLQEKANKRIIIISNSSKRRYDTVDRLHKLNCGMCTHLDIGDVIDGVPAISIFTSGQLVYDGLRALERGEEAPVFEGSLEPSARRVFCFGNGDDDVDYINSAGLTSANIEEADFVLARGLFQTLGEKEAPLSFINGDECDNILRIASERKLPMIVANPDLLRPDSDLSPMPGQLANRYQTYFSGRAICIGKPYPTIYVQILEALKKNRY
mmetsp:Transcript_1375/g.1965  ORF Transcript_1375/g.1965 Transcript_1375/m.1965 type:complete len:276 (-) Transcript_1375:345-1172(-)